jgi:uncharacterized protein
MQRFAYSILLPVCIALGAESTPSEPQPKVKDAVADRFVAAPFEKQKIGGLLGERMRINLEKRLLAVEEEALLAGFRKRPGEQDWIGEHVGKYLDAAAITYRFTHDARLKTQMDRIALALIATQKGDGYLGTYTDDKRWTSWDVWVHKYDLIGLLSWYRLTGDERALMASRRIGDLLIATFQTGKVDMIETSDEAGMAATSVLEPICQLYRFTGDARYLAFAHFIVDKTWEQTNGPKIITSLLAVGSVFKTANNKAYEMMSNLVGLLELYRLTGEERYLAVGQAAQRDIVSRRRYLTGTTSAHEHFRDDFDLPADEKDEVGEGCATVTWLQLNLQLLRLTGEAKYAQEIERTVFNQLLGAQEPHSGNICYFTPMNGRKQPTTNINCCRSSVPRGIALIPGLVWGSFRAGTGPEIAIEILAPGEAMINGVKVVAETGYPFHGTAALTLRSPEPRWFTLALRVPEWAPEMTARLSNGEIHAAKGGEYLRVTRLWKNGDRVDVAMDLAVRFADGGRSYPGHLAVERGPLVLALEKGANLQLRDIQRAALKQRGEPLSEDRVGVYSLAGVVPNGDQTRDTTLRLVPFAEANDYRIWIPLANPPHARSRTQRSKPTASLDGQPSRLTEMSGS